MSRRIDIKICGLTCREDAASAFELGADYLGFVLYGKSPRAVSPLAVARMRDGLPAAARFVAVFVNERRREAEKIARDLELTAVQLHGDEIAADFEEFPCPLWRAVWLKPDGVKPEPGEWTVDRYVLDAAVPGKYGGTGATVDWKRAAELAKDRRVMLAGGLQPGNVAEALRTVSPLGVDVVSGVEASPGRKDLDKLRRFVEEARAVELT